MTSKIFYSDLLKRKSIAVGHYDPFEINYDEKHYELFTDAELVAAVGSTLVFDVECYTNYFLIAFKHVSTKKVVYFEIFNDERPNFDCDKLRWMLHNFWIVGFNSRYYDLPLAFYALENYSNELLKVHSNQIIFDNIRLSNKDFQEKFDIDPTILYHIDLIEVAPLRASLKIYGGRLQAPRLQELPIKHDAVLEPKHYKAIRLYCINDLDLTALLFNDLRQQLDLRYQLSVTSGQDLLSKSDAQIAESVIVSELKKRNGWYPKRPTIEPGTTYKYTPPLYLQFSNPQFNKALEIITKANFAVNETGSIDMPDEIANLELKHGQCTYRMGIGGLHSTEKCVAHKADQDTLILDKDVASYYPAIILNCKLAPKHLGKSFLDVYRDIVNRRLEAKRNGNKVEADSLKITVNGSFGKLGNKYSALYSPDLLIQVTVTGQLCLLMLIDLIENQGIPIISANTDGIIVKCPKAAYNYMEAAVVHWQKITGFDTEETRYLAIYSRDVNNYIAIKEDGKCKVKGVYAEVGSGGNTVLSKNPESLICNDALTAFLAKQVPIEDTVRSCKDIRRFVSLRNVKGGAEKSGIYLGRAIRWYYSTEAKGEINYVLNGNKVPKTDNAMPLMDLPDELPADLDFNYYIENAKEMLKEIGYYPKAKQARLFNLG